MVSVDKIKKKNELSKELKDHGFALDNTDAFEQAEKIYSKDKKSPEVEFADDKREVPEEENKVSEEVERLQERVHSLERKKKFAEKEKEEIQKKLSDVTGQIKDIAKSINQMEMNQKGLHEKIKKLKKSGKEAEKASQPDQEQSVEEQSQAARKVLQKDSPDPHPKKSESGSGQIDTPNEKITSPVDETGVAPSEVSVEKIFYSGTD